MPVIMISGHGTIETAVRTTKMGAYDFIEKPLSLERVSLAVRHGLDEQRLREEDEALKKRIESERFGHERGAFTGATAMNRGKFELADHGTIFLDEIGDMSLATQAKVLRVLEG